MVEQYKKERKMYMRVRNLCGILGVVLPWFLSFLRELPSIPVLNGGGVYRPLIISLLLWWEYYVQPRWSLSHISATTVWTTG